MNDRSESRGESRFLSNTMALVAQTILVTVLTLVQVKLLANWLSKDTFGAFVSLRGFSLLLSILAANGLPSLLVRFIPAHEAQGRRAVAWRLTLGSLGAATAVLVVVTIVVLALGPRAFAFTNLVGVETALLWWFFATTTGVALKMVLYGGLNGLRRLTAQVVLEVVTHGLILAGMVAERESLDIVVLFRIVGVVHVVTLLVALPVYFRAVDRSIPDETDRGREEGTKYSGYLGWAVVMSVVAVAFSDVDRYLLAQVLTMEALALFHIGARVNRLANRLLGVGNMAFQPEITRLDAEGRGTAVATVTRIFIKFGVAVSGVVTCGIVLFTREIIVVVANDSYRDATLLMWILAASLPLSTITAPITTVMKARDQIREALWTDVAWAVSYVGGMFGLAPFMGLVGVGLANLVACVVQLVAALVASRLAVGGAFVLGLLGRVGALCVIVFGPAWAVQFLSFPVLGAGFLKLGLFTAGTVLLFGLLVRFGFYTTEEREILHGLLRRRGLGFACRLV